MCLYIKHCLWLNRERFPTRLQLSPIFDEKWDSDTVTYKAFPYFSWDDFISKFHIKNRQFASICILCFVLNLFLAGLFSVFCSSEFPCAISSCGAPAPQFGHANSHLLPVFFCSAASHLLLSPTPLFPSVSIVCTCTLPDPHLYSARVLLEVYVQAPCVHSTFLNQTNCLRIDILDTILQLQYRPSWSYERLKYYLLFEWAQFEEIVSFWLDWQANG